MVSLKEFKRLRIMRFFFDEMLKNVVYLESGENFGDGGNYVL